MQAAAIPANCCMVEKTTPGLPAATAAAGLSDGPEFFNHLFEVKTLMSQTGQQSNVVRAPVTTPAVHPALPPIATVGTQLRLLRQKSQFFYL